MKTETAMVLLGVFSLAMAIAFDDFGLFYIGLFWIIVTFGGAYALDMIALKTNKVETP